MPFSCFFGVHLSLVNSSYEPSAKFNLPTSSLLFRGRQSQTEKYKRLRFYSWRFGFSFDSNSWENVLNLPSMLQYFDTYWRKKIFSKFFIEACLSKEGICLRPQPLFVATPFVFFKLLGIFHFRLLGLDGPRSFCSHWSGVIFRWCIKTDHVLNSDYGECVILVAGSISSVRGAINLGYYRFMLQISQWLSLVKYRISLVVVCNLCDTCLFPTFPSFSDGDHKWHSVFVTDHGRHHGS